WHHDPKSEADRQFPQQHPLRADCRRVQARAGRARLVWAPRHRKIEEAQAAPSTRPLWQIPVLLHEAAQSCESIVLLRSAGSLTGQPRKPSARRVAGGLPSSPQDLRCGPEEIRSIELMTTGWPGLNQ